ncbi:MAG: class I SAM-dependent methyltransferase [Pedobacter sp.]|uniref:class I SAM-dependent methyltransferase n=1 Tax=Pedobacter sp. TaxID=1411316 RepID=UPI0028074DAA|nr:class I SAM-dependent methyltransferase [Pedobacter sp.]MDQ8004880.1 class I SAM-dependent methyltransferase [Pedobacter sp.]
MLTPQQIQETYYAKTSEQYDKMHLLEGNDLEHDLALHYLISLIKKFKIKSILDVGAGTGRAISFLKSNFPYLKIIGIEPVKELRLIGYSKGLKENELIEGNGYKINFEDNSIDLVCEFGILHHVETPSQVIKEMVRVSKKGIFISDSNNFGQGSLLSRTIKQSLNALKLWPAYNWLRTKGKKYQISEGDGLFYSYSIFTDFKLIKNHYYDVYILSTTNTKGISIYRNSPHGVIFAFDKIL